MTSLALLAVLLAQAPSAEPDARMDWWRQARFGMFIHFGLYSTPAGEWQGRTPEGAGEWLQFNAQIPAADYEPLLNQFNPVKFDADEWVRVARDAGMRYVTITTKHHDGFALFDSKLTEWDVMSTPFRRDVMKEIAGACEKQGLVTCWYHSILDWHHPDYLPRGPGSPRPWDARPTEGASYDRYLDFMEGQLTELLTNYGRIGVIWFDGGWEHTAQEHRGEEVIALIRKLQPQILVNDRIQLPQDFSTPEQYIPATGLSGRDWETCMTMNDTWGFKKNDHHWKSSETLIRNLVDAASKGGNFLLNVGPTGEGEIPKESVERLAAIGRWMRVNGESIYATGASPFRRLAFGRCTTKVARGPTPAGRHLLYLHVFDWPADGKLRLPGLKSRPIEASLLGEPGRNGVLALRDGGDVVVLLPGEALDPVDTVVALQISGPPEVTPPVVKPLADGTLRLDAIDADVHGGQARFEAETDKQCIGFWSDARDFVSWDLELAEPARLKLAVDYACDPGSEGAEVIVSLARPEMPGPEQRFSIASTGAWNRFQTAEVGTLPTLDAGRWTLTVKPASKPRYAVMNLRAVTLAPAK